MPGDVSQNFGYFIPLTDYTPSLVIRPQSFNDLVKTVQKYLLFDATRSSDGTVIQGDYNDTGSNTDQVYFTVYYPNGTEVYSASSGADQVTFQYNSADNETDFRVEILAVTPVGYFGNITYYEAFGGVDSMPQFNLSSLGTPVAGGPGMTAPDVGQLVGVGIMLLPSLAVSVASAPLGILVTVILGAMLVSWGWLTINTTLLGAGATLAIIVIIVGAKWTLKGR